MIGGLFYELCDEVNELDWVVALQQLIELLEDTLRHTNKGIQKVNCNNWLQVYPMTSRHTCLSTCESRVPY